MSKYFNALAVGVLVITLLIGAGVAVAVDTVDLDGCFIPADYIVLDTSNLDTDVGLVDLPATDVDGGTIDIIAGDDWKLTCIETGGSTDGKMSLGTDVLNDPLEVLDWPLSDEAEQVLNGYPTLCDGGDIEPSTVPITYTQTIDSVNDLGKAAGTYSIQIQYTLQLA